jgi:hypothetical protein
MWWLSGLEKPSSPELGGMRLGDFTVLHSRIPIMWLGEMFGGG